MNVNETIPQNMSSELYRHIVNVHVYLLLGHDFKMQYGDNTKKTLIYCKPSLMPVIGATTGYMYM